MHGLPRKGTRERRLALLVRRRYEVFTEAPQEMAVSSSSKSTGQRQPSCTLLPAAVVDCKLIGCVET